MRTRLRNRYHRLRTRLFLVRLLRVDLGLRLTTGGVLGLVGTSVSVSVWVLHLPLHQRLYHRRQLRLQEEEYRNLEHPLTL